MRCYYFFCQTVPLRDTFFPHTAQTIFISPRGSVLMSETTQCTNQRIYSTVGISDMTCLGLRHKGSEFRPFWPVRERVCVSQGKSEWQLWPSICQQRQSLDTAAAGAAQEWRLSHWYNTLRMMQGNTAEKCGEGYNFFHCTSCIWMNLVNISALFNLSIY